MKCPSCKGDNYKTDENDPDLMSCEDCHSVYSVAWSIGYWHGYLDAERECKEE